MAATPPLPPPVVRGRRDATERILKAAATRLSLSGASALTLHEVAEEAGVSKALIHYHFQDKDTLLARLVEWMADGLVRRERGALATSTPVGAIDDLWRWLEGELARGHARALVELAAWRGARVRAAAGDAMRLRRAASAASAERLYTLLALRPRVPTVLVGDLLVTFVDGLAAAPEGDGKADSRGAFDVLWLALLGLAE
ncbi:MAG TPA: TetR/AcrR family transcriptional regulator [Gemmatimonadaceae bacterium]|nr:TetR/AcrR family transcriptional regulator [Gemmatimonadaceae bacterium]